MEFREIPDRPRRARARALRAHREAARQRPDAGHRGRALRTRAILLWTLAYGLVWNLLGWLGNVLLLGGAWRAVDAQLAAGFAPPWPDLVREMLTLLSDFVYAFAFVWLFARFQLRTTAAAIGLVLVIWLAGAGMTYTALVNAGFLPWPIAVKTSLLALVIFVATAPLLPRRLAGGNRQS